MAEMAVRIRNYKVLAIPRNLIHVVSVLLCCFRLI